MWRSDILGPMVQAGISVSAAGEATAEWSDALAEQTDRAILALLHGHQATAWMRNILEGFELTLVQAGLHERVERPTAICFLDLTGYTRLTEQFGDEAAADLAARLSGLVQTTSGRHGGRPVKWLGDGVMFVFREPAGAVRAALEMVDTARREEMPPAHVGLHAGPVLFQEGDYFGRTVNLAARIADYARQGEVLVSQDVVDACADTELSFREIGPVELKGVPSRSGCTSPCRTTEREARSHKPGVEESSGAHSEPGVLRQRHAEVLARCDAELREHLAQVPIDGATFADVRRILTGLLDAGPKLSARAVRGSASSP